MNTEKCTGEEHTIQIVSRHEQLETELRRNVEIGDIACVAILFVVVKVLADFFEHHPVDVIELARVVR